MSAPNPLVMEDLFMRHRHTHTRDELRMCWFTAHLEWGLRPEYTGEGEPAEVSAARALHVTATAKGTDPRVGQALQSAIRILISPYTH